jgi:sterol 3beta-glucosyltransferase
MTAMEHMNIRILAMGTRGDVQPYVTLGLGLQRVGHEVTLGATDDRLGPTVGPGGVECSGFGLQC